MGQQALAPTLCPLAHIQFTLWLASQFQTFTGLMRSYSRKAKSERTVESNTNDTREVSLLKRMNFAMFNVVQSLCQTKEYFSKTHVK